jgi:hypothetical protein
MDAAPYAMVCREADDAHALQGVPLSTAAPADGQFLKFSAGQWAAAPGIHSFVLERTGLVNLSTNTGSANVWTTIPGLRANFTLPSAALVHILANGVQRTFHAGAGTTDLCHVGYRFTIDNQPQGDPTWGQRIQVSSSAYSWHQTWTLSDGISLAAGTHAVQVDVTLPAAGGNAQCYACGEADGSLAPYDSCSLQIVVVPQ